MGRSSRFRTAVRIGPTLRAAALAISTGSKDGRLGLVEGVTDPGDVDPDPGTTAPAAGGTGRDCGAAALEAATDAARALRLAASEDDALRGRASPVVEARGPVRVAVDPRDDVASPESLDWVSGPAETEVEPESESESEELSADATPTA